MYIYVYIHIYIYIYILKRLTPVRLAFRKAVSLNLGSVNYTRRTTDSNVSEVSRDYDYWTANEDAMVGLRTVNCVTITNYPLQMMSEQLQGG